MGSVVLKSLSALLGLFFIFVGILKITPKFSKELHRDLRKEYVNYAKVFPFSQTLSFRIPSKWYRRTIGGLEIISGLALAFVRNKKIKRFANLILILLMLLAVYSHWVLDNRFERSAPGLVFLFMLTCRLVVEWQLDREPSSPESAKQQPVGAGDINGQAQTNKAEKED